MKSKRAGQRAFESITRFVEEKLKLRVNREKSAVARAHQRKLLGYSFTWHKQPKIRVPEETVWKQWKKPWTRRKRLIEAGLSEERAVMSAFNRRGSWWNSGASHMNEAFRKKFFDRLGLVSMIDELYKFRIV